jgi:hypothetical protein
MIMIVSVGVAMAMPMVGVAKGCEADYINQKAKGADNE